MKNILFLFLVVSIGFSSCKKKVNGCTDSTATNYNIEATDDDGSCTYPEPVPAVEYSIEFVAYQATGYNTDLNVYDGSTLIGNLSNHTTTLFQDDIWNVTSTQGGLIYVTPLGTAELVRIENQAGDTLIQFDGGITNADGIIETESGFIIGQGQSVRSQSINNNTTLLISVEAPL